MARFIESTSPSGKDRVAINVEQITYIAAQADGCRVMFDHDRSVNVAMKYDELVKYCGLR